MKIALEKGMRVPEDLSIIGYTNGAISKYSTPSLSSVVQHGYKMGQTSAKMLLDRVVSTGSAMSAQRSVIGADIVLRESTL